MRPVHVLGAGSSCLKHSRDKIQSRPFPAVGNLHANRPSCGRCSCTDDVVIRCKRFQLHVLISEEEHQPEALEAMAMIIRKDIILHLVVPSISRAFIVKNVRDRPLSAKARKLLVPAAYRQLHDAT